MGDYLDELIMPESLRAEAKRYRIEVENLRVENSALRGLARQAIETLMGCAGWDDYCYVCEAVEYCQALNEGE